MIIGFDASRAFLKDKTGTENYSYQLLKTLAKIDHHNSYMVYLRLQGQALGGWPKNFHFKTINWPRFWTQAGLALHSFKDALDVLFIPAHTLPVIRRPGLKSIMTVHDLGSEYLPEMHQVKQRLYLSLMQKYQLQTATKLIAVSKATKDDLIKRVGVDSKKIEVIYEGFDKENFKLQIPNVKYDRLVNTLKHYDLVPGKYFLFVGTVQPRKNLERIIEAYAKYLRVTRGDAEEGSRRVAAASETSEDARRDTEAAGPRVSHPRSMPNILALLQKLSTFLPPSILLSPMKDLGDLTSTDLIFNPIIFFCRPNLIVSTSGSSGI